MQVVIDIPNSANCKLEPIVNIFFRKRTSGPEILEGDALLLNDTDYLLLEDGVSKLLFG